MESAIEAKVYVQFGKLVYGNVEAPSTGKDTPGGFKTNFRGRSDLSAILSSIVMFLGQVCLDPVRGSYLWPLGVVPSSDEDQKD